jgi:hypothetical protein
MPCCLATTDLARWEPCVVPSTWRSPTARRPTGKPSTRPAATSWSFALGSRVEALGGGRRDATPGPSPAMLVDDRYGDKRALFGGRRDRE